MENFALGFFAASALLVGFDIYWHRAWVKKFVATELGKLKQFSAAELKTLEANPAYQKCDWCAHIVARYVVREDGRVACQNCQHDHGV